MKQTDIETIFTEKVAEYISKGYTLNLTTMNGSQGEIAKVDVRKDDEVIRILLEHKSEALTGYRYCDYMMLTVGTAKVDKRTARPFDTFSTTLWNDSLDIVEQRKFYQISPSSDFFTEDVEAFIIMLDKHYKRYANRYQISKEYLDGEAIEVAKRYIKRTVGLSRVSTNHIRVKKVTRGKVGYIVEYRGKTFKLH